MINSDDFEVIGRTAPIATCAKCRATDGNNKCRACPTR